MRLPSFFLLLALCACSLPQSSGRTAPSGSADGRLGVSIFASTPGAPIALRVTRPAYVAVFELVPGGGAALVYPRSGENALLVGGLEQSIFASRFGARSIGLATDPYGPRYLFVIASEFPLDLNRIERLIYGGVGSMGPRWASFNALSMMETITWLMVPDLGDFSTWDTDYSVYWPESSVPSVTFANSLVPVECRGRQWYVPAEYYATVYQQLCVATTPRDSLDSAPEAPGRRAPLPVAGAPQGAGDGGPRPGRRAPDSPPPAESAAPASSGGDTPGRRPIPTTPQSQPDSERAPIEPPAPAPTPRPEAAPEPRPAPPPTPTPAPERDRPTPASGQDSSPDK